MNTLLLECQNLTFGYDSSKFVLNDVSFSLFQGEFVSLLGPNGAGKSTLMKLILNRFRQKSGQIFLEGVSLSKMTDRQIAKEIGYVEQNTPRSSMSAFDFILLGSIAQFQKQRFWYTHEEKQSARELMADFGISHLENHPIDKISGGEQQLVQICRALISSPKLLLLDEPVSHLDVQHIEMVIQLLLKIKKERNVTVLSSLHDLYLASSCSERMFLLNRSGSLLVDSSPSHPDLNLLEKVFITPFEYAQLNENNQKVVIPRYRFR